MPDPELFVAFGQQFIDARAQRVWHEQVKAAGDMQGFGIVAPGKIHKIRAPVPRNFDNDLVSAASFKVPLVGLGDVFDKQQRIVVVHFAVILHQVVHIKSISLYRQRARTIGLSWRACNHCGYKGALRETQWRTNLRVDPPCIPINH